MSQLRADDFQPHVGGRFQLQLEEGDLALQLDSLRPFETSATEGFSLLFSGPRQRLLAQGVRRLVHQDMGAVDLFLVPVMDRRSEVYTYEAVFNRLKPAARAAASGEAP